MKKWQKPQKSSLEILFEDIWREMHSDISLPDQQMIAGYCVDFCIREYRIIVEIDGEYWHQKPRRKFFDEQREKVLRRHGFYVMRFWGKHILLKPMDCCKVLYSLIERIQYLRNGKKYAVA